LSAKLQDSSPNFNLAEGIMKRILVMVSVFAVLAFTGGVASPPTSSSAVANWTELGPAPTVNGTTTYTEPASGRITGIAADPSDPLGNTIYIATAGGGVWKTVNGGTDWTPLTETQGTLFMGAIAVAPSDPNTIYAGTG
jgi:hypothetical protein